MPHYSVAVARTIRAPVESAFDAWTDPDTIRRWMKPKPWVSVPEAVVRPEPGGQFRIVMRDASREERHEGTFQTVERPSKLRFTWSSDAAGPDTVVTVAFEGAGPAETVVSLLHEGLQSQTARENHREGWRQILDHLAAAIESAH